MNTRLTGVEAARRAGYVSLDVAARLAGVSEMELVSLIALGAVHGVRVGGRILVSKVSAQRLAASRQTTEEKT